jgi:hypothetical protein
VHLYYKDQQVNALHEDIQIWMTKNMLNTQTDCVDKVQCYVCNTLYHATHITPVAVTVICKGLIQLP